MEKLINEFSFGLFFWQLLIFVGLIFLLKKFAWKPILDSVNEREDSIKEALSSAEEAKKRGTEPMGTIKAWATEGIDPAIMGAGPIPASKKALEKAGWSSDQLDLIEANEAFAAQSCAVTKEMGWPSDKVNVNGGAIALGHPRGASGTGIMVTLLHEMKRRDVKKGLATLCIGGGMGIAMCVER